MTHITRTWTWITVLLLSCTLLACDQAATTEKEGETTEKTPGESPWFQISLAQWSLHKATQSGELTIKDFPRVAKDSFGITGVEYVSQLFDEDEKTGAYLAELKKYTDQIGVKNVLIMIDNEGDLGVTDASERQEAVNKHKVWVDRAAILGCTSIRVNAHGDDDPSTRRAALVNALSQLGEYATTKNINVIIENHGGISSDGGWLSGVIKQVNRDNVGTLPDFGNFCIEGSPKDDCQNAYDRYKGMNELLPFAKGVSAKTYDFDENGAQTKMEYTKLMKQVYDSGYRGFIGIEYEGDAQSEYTGIRMTKVLLEKYNLESKLSASVE